MHKAPPVNIPVQIPTPPVKWMANYKSDDAVQFYGFSAKVMNMFIKALNERKATISDFQMFWEECPGQTGGNFFNSGFRKYLARLIPAIETIAPVTEFGLVTSTSQTSIQSSFARATLVSNDLIFSDLDILDIQTFYTAAKDRGSNLYIWIRGERQTVDAIISLTQVSVAEPFSDEFDSGEPIFFSTDPLITFDDPTKTTYGWSTLQNDVVALAPYFVKNQLADKSTPENFFEYCNCLNSWQQTTDQIFTDFSSVPDWEQDLIPYGPKDKTPAQMLRRKYPREITIADVATLEDDGTYTYSATIDPDTNELDGIILTRTKDGGFADMADPANQEEYPELIVTVGQTARLVGDLIDPTNPAFTYYVKGLLFTFDGTSWIMDNDASIPDTLSTIGPIQVRDIFGPWILEDIRDILNLYTWTFISIAGYLPLDARFAYSNANDDRQGGPSFHYNQFVGQGSASTTFIKGQFFFTLSHYTQITGPLAIGGRISFPGICDATITNIVGNVVTFDPPMPAVAQSGFIIINSEWYAATTDKTRFLRELKVSDVKGTLSSGMAASFADHRTTASGYDNRTSILIIQTPIQTDAPAGTKITASDPYPIFGGFQRESTAGNQTNQPLSPFNYTYSDVFTWYSFDPSVITHICDPFDPLPHQADPSAIWGAFPIFTGGAAGQPIFIGDAFEYDYSIIAGQNPDSRSIPRDYDLYQGIQNTVENIFDIPLPLPTLVPKYKYTFLKRLTGLLPQDNANRNLDWPTTPWPVYTIQTRDFNYGELDGDNVLICKWKFKYSKENNDSE